MQSNKSSRGRPRAASSKNPLVNERRERNRNAQKVTRNRRGIELAKRDAEIERLHNIIDDLSSTFLKTTGRVFRRTDAKQDESLIRDVAVLTRDFLSKAKQAEALGAQHDHQSTDDSASTGTSSEPSEDRREYTDDRDSCDSAEWQPNLGTAIAPAASGAWNPRFDFGLLWAPDAFVVNGPGRNIEYEIRAGMDSFAARLFYASVLLAFDELLDERRTLAPRMFRLTNKYEPIRLTRQKTLECYKRLHHQTSPRLSEDVRLDEKCAGWLAQQCEEDLAREEPGSGRSLPLLEVEEYLRSTWSIHVDSTTATRKQLQMYPSGHSRVSVSAPVATSILISAIAPDCLCFGNGPRFTTARIDACVQKLSWSP